MKLPVDQMSNYVCPHYNGGKGIKTAVFPKQWNIFEKLQLLDKAESLPSQRFNIGLKPMMVVYTGKTTETVFVKQVIIWYVSIHQLVNCSLQY